MKYIIIEKIKSGNLKIKINKIITNILKMSDDIEEL